MREKTAFEILRNLKELYEKHINRFTVSSYMDDMEQIEMLFQKLTHLDISDEIHNSEEWKVLCSQVYEMNIKLTDIVSRKKIAMNRSKNVDYTSSRNNYDAFYIDQKG
ncbi:hypothetical protein P4H39_31680 [Paenibacillus lautus]|uniref:hypothetical protein n=1 Tax=Paenibacillus lautus TaxID=1401 RepID=UPI002DBB4CB4|nr:hypothetical protein [Paenibacillus lautus]MEC0207173.1 hypothetical protein [Paenibacillus lautus]